MGKNDIALSFDKAEYYSLEEASEYLNRKHGIDNITPKKLLKNISSYDINTYIHFRMDNLKDHEKVAFEFDFYNSNVFNDDEKLLFDGREDYIQSRIAICDKINENISNKIKDDLYIGFILFLVDKRTIQNMALSMKPQSNETLFCFDGFIYRDNLDDNPINPKQLKEWQININDKDYYINDVANLSIKILSKDEKILEEFKNKLPFSCDFYTFDDWDIVFANLEITIGDLIIIHKDLETLENNIINNAPIPEKELTKISDIHNFMSKQGVSPRNQDDKLIAMMAILLADNQSKYDWGGKPNKSAIEKAIQDLIDNRFFIDSKHTHGLEAPSKRIGKCLDDFSQYFYTQPKPKE